MRSTFLFLFLALVMSWQALADDNDRSERRNLRDRRAQMRVAVERVNNCVRTGDLRPCLQNHNEDLSVKRALLALYRSRRAHSVAVDVGALSELNRNR